MKNGSLVLRTALDRSVERSRPEFAAERVRGGLDGDRPVPWFGGGVDGAKRVSYIRELTAGLPLGLDCLLIISNPRHITWSLVLGDHGENWSLVFQTSGGRVQGFTYPYGGENCSHRFY
jgi:hypothetical protein